MDMQDRIMRYARQSVKNFTHEIVENNTTLRFENDGFGYDVDPLTQDIIVGCLEQFLKDTGDYAEVVVNDKRKTL